MSATALDSLLDNILGTNSSGTAAGLMTIADFWQDATLPPAAPVSQQVANQQQPAGPTGTYVHTQTQLPPSVAPQQGLRVTASAEEMAAMNKPKRKVKQVNRARHPAPSYQRHSRGLSSLVAESVKQVAAMNQPTRKLKRKAGSSSIEEAWATVEDRRRAQNRRHAAASRQRKVNALHEASAEGSRLKKQNELLTLTLREASAELEYVLECIEDLPTEHRDAIVNKHDAFSASRTAANSALKGL